MTKIDNTARNQKLLDKFIEDNQGISCVVNRKLLFGIGINDADYAISPTIDGKRVMCVFYQTWTDMIERCYSPKYQERCPTYKGCIICDEWHSFMNFKRWMVGQDHEGKQLDKDILVIGNKIYSPDRCVFVSQSINKLLTDRGAKRGIYPQGVSRQRGEYKARVSINGKGTHIGRYTTVQEAEAAYIKAKSTNIIIKALEQSSTKLMKALVTHAKHMRTHFECKQQAMA